MASLAQLKKKRGANLKNLQKKLEESQQGGFPKDDRIWKPKFNKDKGKGTAIVRFLPTKDGDPFVEVKNYSFNGPGGNFYDLARCTIGEEDPIQIAAINAFRKAKTDGDKQLKEKAKKWLAKSQYYANVYVVKDEENPDNEGKVFIYQFGRAIYLKLEAAIKPEFDDVEPIDPFDLWEGANFKIRMVSATMPDPKTGTTIVVPNYDNSEFDKCSEFLDGDDEKLDEVFDKTYILDEFVDAEKFKSFEEHAERFKKVMGHSYKWLSQDGLEEHVKENYEDKESDDTPESSNETQTDKNIDEDDDIPFEVDDSEEEDPVDKFKRLAGG